MMKPKPGTGPREVGVGVGAGAGVGVGVGVDTGVGGTGAGAGAREGWNVIVPSSPTERLSLYPISANPGAMISVGSAGADGVGVAGSV